MDGSEEDEKAEASIRVRRDSASNETDTRALQFAKHDAPITCTDAGMEID
jgi:hypothetical protein